MFQWQSMGRQARSDCGDCERCDMRSWCGLRNSSINLIFSHDFEGSWGWTGDGEMICG